MDLYTPLNKVKECDFEEAKAVMFERAERRRKNMPFFQKIAFKIIKKECSLKNVSVVDTESVHFCESISRFYAIDIYIPEIKLAFEIDGKQHENQYAKKRLRRAKDKFIKQTLNISINNN